MKELIKKYALASDPYFRVFAAVYIILSSMYDIFQDVEVIRKEHGLLLIGFFMLARACFEFRHHLKEIVEEAKAKDEFAT